MKFYKFDQCCCGCSLRTGTIVIGVISMLIEIGLFVLNVIEINSGFDIDTEMEDMTSNPIGPIVSVGVRMVTATLVLVAAWKNRRPMLLIPWLVLSALLLHVLLGTSLFFGTLLTIRMGASTGTAFVAVTLLTVVIFFYFWLVVFNFYHELKTNKDRDPEEKSHILGFEYADNNNVIFV